MSKYSKEIIVLACKDYLARKLSHQEICEKYEITYNPKKQKSMLNEWIHRYLADGEQAFIRLPGNSKYTSEFKMKIVKEYLAGGKSYIEIAAKYNVPSKETVRRWVMSYNANRTLKDYDPKGEVYMAEAKRKTTLNERKDIVRYCLSHNRNYKDAASKYDVSYSQVYSWVKKYDANGENSLIDKRGHHKPDDEVDELERLRRENLRLKRKLQESEMANQLLKKVKEFERM